MEKKNLKIFFRDPRQCFIQEKNLFSPGCDYFNWKFFHVDWALKYKSDFREIISLAIQIRQFESLYLVR
jgi:hypothetical protein